MLKFSSNSLVLIFVTLAIQSIVGGIINDINLYGEQEAVVPIEAVDYNDDITALATGKCNLRYSCFKGRHYYFETSTQRSRDDAARYCNAINMELLSVEDCEENAFITNLLKSQNNCGNKNYWISAYQNGNRNWRWESGVELSYTNWKLSEPNYKKNEYCVHYRYNFLQWNDEACSTKYYFICESNNACA